MLRKIKESEYDQLINLALETGLWQVEEAELLLGSTLKEALQDTLPANHFVMALDSDEELAGWTYFAESGHSPGVWDVWWIGVHPKFQGQGLGRTMLMRIEELIKEKNGRLIIIETSSTPL